MNSNVRLYDTFKDKENYRYRVIEVGNDTVKLVRLNEDGSRKKQGGRPRILTIADLFANYSRVNLPPVTVTKQEPKGTPREPEGNQPTPLPESIRENVEIIQQVKDAGEDIEILKAELKDRIRESIDLKKTISKMQQAHDSEVAELNDRIMELEILVQKKNEYADALDTDSEVFADIATIASAIDRTTLAVTNLARLISTKAEDRI